jgi:outer membrane cobalamin receptor
VKIIFVCIIFILNVFSVKAESLPNCKWDNRSGTPCVNITKTNNTSRISEAGVFKTVINKQDIINSGANSVIDILKTVSGLAIYQSGPAGQITSIFTRGSESNHTMVLLNGIAINDQSSNKWSCMILVKTLFKLYSKLKFTKGHQWCSIWSKCYCRSYKFYY